MCCNATKDWFQHQFMECTTITLSYIQGETSSLPVYQWIIHVYSLFAAAISALSSTNFISADEVRRSAILSCQIFQWLMITASKISLDAIQTQGVYGHEIFKIKNFDSG